MFSPFPDLLKAMLPTMSLCHQLLKSITHRFVKADGGLVLAGVPNCTDGFLGDVIAKLNVCRSM